MSGQARRWFAVVSVAAGLLGLTGFLVSFERVSARARPFFGWLAPAVPLGVDLAIGVFSAAGLLLAYLDMPARWLRLVPAGLTAATVWLNVSGLSDSFAVAAHAVLPGLWIVSVAIGEHVIRHRLALATGRRMDAVRLSRWALAPLATLGLWRRMVLWEVRSYADALDRERRRLLAVAWLRDSYGPLWRARAPRRLRVLHRLGELDPDRATRLTDPVPDSNPVGQSDDPTTRPGPDPIDPADPTARPDSPTDADPTESGVGSGAGRRRSAERVRAEVVRLIDAGALPGRPTADAIRRAAACSSATARSVRDALRAAVPAQTGAGSAGPGPDHGGTEVGP